MIELNDEQRAAVVEPSPDFVLAAGAGSGKTRVLTERFAAEVRANGSAAFDSTLAITFTEKAAGELWERVRSQVADCGDSELADGLDRAWISTIHSMCSRLLRRHALDVGLDPRFCIGTAVELGVLRKQVFDDTIRDAITAPESQDLTLLIHSFRLPELFGIVTGMAEQVRAMGLSSNQITTYPSEFSEELPGLLDCLRVLVADYAQEKATKTVLANAAALEELIVFGRSWIAGGMSSRDLAGVARSLKQPRTGSPEVKDIAQQAKDIAERIALGAAQDAVRPYESALVELVARFSDAYRRARADARLLDFEDLQAFVIELLEQNPGIAARYASQFSSVMVDEFQDTNALQVRLIDSLAPGGFFAVGDERQSIYRFRHADVDMFRRREESAAVRHTLRSNYRSHPELVRFFNGAFGREPFWPEGFMHLQPGRAEEPGTPPKAQEESPRVTAILIDAATCEQKRDADEATLLAAHVRSLVDDGVRPGDIAILLRAMTPADTFAGALRDAGIEVFVASGGTYFDRPEVVDLEMLLRLASNTNDTEALLHVLAGPLSALSDNGLGRLRLAAGTGSLWVACRDREGLDLESADHESLERVMFTVDRLRDGVGRSGLADMLHEACELLEYDLTLFARGFEGARAWSNVLKLARIAADFESRAPGDVQGFLEYLDLKRELEGHESLAAFAVEGIDAVRIMSIHSAKGLQFPVTIVANLGRKPVAPKSVILSTGGGLARLGMRLPRSEESPESLETAGYRVVVQAECDAALAEEKRLFYVACTRAQERLVLCGKTRFAKESESPVLVGWLRETLGFLAPDSVTRGDVTVGDAHVRVETPAPLGCGPVGLVRPGVDAHALEIASGSRPCLPVGSVRTPERISYSGLARYRACPYRYYVSSVARLGSRSPCVTGGDAAVALGNAVHALLKVAEDACAPSSARVRELCTYSGLPPEMWGDVSALAQNFFASETGKRVENADRVAREVPFSVALEGTRLEGAIDLIAWNADVALVVDYKTGEPKGDQGPDFYRSQAECYAVAAFALGAARVEVRFLELKAGCRTTTFEYELQDAPGLTSTLSAQASGLVSGRFEPLERYDPFACPECPALGSLCPVSAPGRKPVV